MTNFPSSRRRLSFVAAAIAALVVATSTAPAHASTATTQDPYKQRDNVRKQQKAISGEISSLKQTDKQRAAQVAQALGVTPLTVQRWISDDDAPLVCRLALFYVTRYGRSAVAAQAENDAQIFRTSVEHYRREADRRTRDVQRLLAVGDFGTANDPLVSVSPLVSVLPSPKRAG